MKSYPSISHHDEKYLNNQCWGFQKLDGSNLRFEWSKKRGWYKFGTKNVMINGPESGYWKGVEIFMEKYSKDLDKIFRTDPEFRNIESFVVFGEYFGPNSFSGQHSQEDEMDVVIIDVSAYKKGFIDPNTFVSKFSHLGIPEVLYKGPYTSELIEDIKNSKYQTPEGLVLKGVSENKIWMTKVKNREWLNKVRKLYGTGGVEKELNGDKKLISEYE